MVRLKVFVSCHPETLFSAFQFLMVRLKVSMFNALKEMAEISIPYGAIKSARKSIPPPRRTQISIPYGAIKSKEKKGYNVVGRKFQFLMVRLKVDSLWIPIVMCL